MDVTMKKALRVLVISALTLLATGALVYHRGSQINIEVQKADQFLWEQSPGDKWLYAGGVMMLISGSLSLAAVRIWFGRNREEPICCVKSEVKRGNPPTGPLGLTL